MSSADNSKPTNAQCLAIDLGAGSGRLVAGRILDGRWNLKEISSACVIESMAYCTMLILFL